MGIKDRLFTFLSLYKTALKPYFADPAFFQLGKGGNNLLSRLRYGFNAANFRLITTERIVEMPFVYSNLGLPKGAEILDFGCNYSKLSLEMASAGYKVTGTDLNDCGLEHPNFTFVKGDFSKNTLPGDRFDAIVAVSALEHSGMGSYGGGTYTRADDTILGEFHRVLKTGGKLIITVPFGKNEEGEGYRIYDDVSLAGLIKKFKILKSEYYMGMDRKFWLPAAKEELSAVSSKDIVQGVACLLLEK
ncbi:MAG: class I SAM-dependent methyltransferase [Elusimicrobiota bacterium]